MFKTYINTLLILAIMLLAGCSDLSSTQEKEANEALRALGEIDAATDIGIGYRDYGSLVLKAHTQVKRTIEILPKGELKDELSSAMDGYIDALNVWRYKLEDRKNVSMYEYNEPGRSLIPKYSLIQHLETDENASRVTTEEAIPVIWHYAEEHYRKAKDLLE